MSRPSCIAATIAALPAFGLTTARDIAEAIDIVPKTARTHLRILVEAGYVREAGRLHVPGRYKDPMQWERTSSNEA